MACLEYKMLKSQFTHLRFYSEELRVSILSASDSVLFSPWLWAEAADRAVSQHLCGHMSLSLSTGPGGRADAERWSCGLWAGCRTTWQPPSRAVVAG